MTEPTEEPFFATQSNKKQSIVSATVSGVFTSHVAQNRQSSLALDMIALEEFVIAYVTNVTARISKKRMRKAGVAVAHRVVVSKIALPHVYLVTFGHSKVPSR